MDNNSQPLPPQTPPTNTLNPNQLFPPANNQPYVSTANYANAVPAPSNKKIRLLVILLLLLVLIIGAGTVWTDTQNNPVNLFNKSLQNSLSTSGVEQTVTSHSDSATIVYDVADTKNPIVSGKVTYDLSGRNLSIVGYGTLQNTYMEYSSFGSTTLNTTYGAYLNKWVQIRKNGVYEPTADILTNPTTDPRVQLFGPYIFGNFTSAQRQSLLNYLETNNVYAFNTSKVVKGTVDGQAVLIYPVSINGTKLQAYDKKVAAIFNIPVGYIQPVLNALGSNSSTVTMDVTTKSKRLIRISATESGQTTTSTYANYNDVATPSEPTAQYTLAQYEQLISKTE